MKVSINVHPRLLSTVSLLLTKEEGRLELWREEDEGILIAFRCSDSQLEEMADSFEENAKAIRRYLSELQEGLRS